MADTKLADLTAITTPSGDDILYVVDDPAGTPLDRKIALNNLFTRGTVTTSSPVIDAAQTWNAGGVTFTGLKFNATDTASAAASLLMDLQVDGSSRFNVGKTGSLKLGVSPTGTNQAGTNVTIAGSQGTGTGAGGSIIFQVAPAGSSGTAQNALATALTIASTGAATFSSHVAIGANSNIYTPSGRINIASGVSWGLTVQSGRVSLANSTDALTWGSGSNAADVYLYRDDANTLALRNGANNQELRVYGSFTSAAVYDRLTLKSSSTVATVAAETDAGDMDLALTPAGSGNVQFGTHAAIVAETLTGYITIKDAGGTLRKLAVIS